MRIGYAETSLSVSETESAIVLEIQLLEGTIAPELGNIVVTVSTSDQTASGELFYILSTKVCSVNILGYSTCSYMHAQ